VGKESGSGVGGEELWVVFCFKLFIFFLFSFFFFYNFNTSHTVF